MTDFFNFEANDLQVIEEFEFDETVQRDERVRFYTLEEQTVDAYEKFLPRGHVSRYKLDELRKEVDKLRDLYETYIVPTAETYEVREPTPVKHVPWVIPVYSARNLRPYNFTSSWAPLFASQNVRLPGAYPRILDALPRPYVESDGTPYIFDTITDFVDTNGRNPLRALPVLHVVRTQRHEDSSFDVVAVPREGTADRMNFVGYYLGKRGLDIPNPLAGHPFFENAEPRMLEAPQPLADVFPQIDAILDHGVPVTTDPYRVAMPYLKVYDVRLSDIPWNVWKSKFPQAEVVDQMPEVTDIRFPVPDQLAPPESLVRDYRSPYYPGLSNRFWLMRQLDGGEYQIRRLLADVVSAGGSVPLGPLPSLETLRYPDTTPTAQECALLGKSFIQFQTQGTLRAKQDKGRMAYKCVPLDYVLQERAQLGYLGRKPWTEATPSEIVKTYQDAMKTYMMPAIPAVKTLSEARTPAAEMSQQRRDVVAVLEDPKRYPEDKLYDLNRLLRESTLSQNIYRDGSGQFVLCAHTLAMLAGDLNNDRKAFHEKWTKPEAGFRVCSFCGERVVSEDYVEQTEYNDEGFVVQRTSAMGELTFHSEGASKVLTGLHAIRPMFLEDNASDSMVFLLLTLLQVVPDASAIQPVLLAGRAYADEIEGKDEKAKKARGAVGVVTAALILQTHIPTLLPRRSFGPKPLKLSGYPRDRATPEEYTILDSLVMVLRKTFEAYPGTFKDVTVHAIRWLISNPGNFKKTTLAIMDNLLEEYPVLGSLLDRAKAHIATLPAVVEVPTLLPAVRPPEKLNTVHSFPDCSTLRPFWMGPHAPTIVQPRLELRTGIQASPRMVIVDVSRSQRVLPKLPADAEIARMFKRGVPARFKKAVEVKDDWRVNSMLASHLSDMFELRLNVLQLDPMGDASKRKNYAKGLVYEALHLIDEDPVKRTKFLDSLDKDVALYTLTSDLTAERRKYNSIRALERKAFTDRMRAMTDLEREITSELVRLGLSAPVVTPADRELFATQIEDVPEEDEGVEQTDDEIARQQDAMYGGPAEDTFVPENDADDMGVDVDLPQLQDDADTSI